MKNKILIPVAVIISLSFIVFPTKVLATPGQWSASGSTIYYEDGNVGIGTASPGTYKLAVNATTGWTGRFQNQGSDVRLAYNNHGIYVKTSTTGGEAIIQLHNNTSPIFYVTANGTGYLDGTFKTKQLIVKQNVWADYVFDEDYYLMPLSEVEKFINANGHLPNIPSEEELSGEISVGDMQRKQMEKIEELTLHLIEKEKQIDELQKRLAKIENLILEIK